MTSSSLNVWADVSRRMRASIDRALQHYATWNDDCPEALGAAIRHSLLGPGKRLRPMLVLMAASACGSKEGAAMPAACAVEMVHTYSLIHDDLPAMDDDDMRRGRPSCHAQFGEATAILAGDALLAMAFGVLAGDVKPPDIAARCCAALARAAGPTAMVGGQADDMNAEFQVGDVALLESIHRRKTGAMIRVSLELGGLVAGAVDEQMAALDAYGKRLGLAFQIVDDCLDLRGNEESMGKRLGKDSAHGKLTFPALLGLQASQQRAGKLIQEACQALSVFQQRAGNLESLAHFVIQRTR